MNRRDFTYPSGQWSRFLPGLALLMVLAVGGGLKGSMVVLTLALAGLGLWSALGLRALTRGLRITADDRGLHVFPLLGEKRTILWEEITSVERVHGVWADDVRLIRIASAKGSIEVSERLGGLQELLELLRRRCRPHTAVTTLPAEVGRE